MRVSQTEFFIKEINELIHSNLDKRWMAVQWELLEKGMDENKIHPLARVAFKAHKQINDLISSCSFDMSEEIWEISDLAIYVNTLKRSSVKGLKNRLRRLISDDFAQYSSLRYEIQVAGMLLGKRHDVEFIEEGDAKTPDILITNGNDRCEIECKHKESGEDQIDYIKSIYNNTQRARRQFSKTHAGAIFIEVNKRKYDDFLQEGERLASEMDRAMRGSSSISAICLTSKIAFEDENDFVYRHRANIRLSANTKIAVPVIFLQGLISNNSKELGGGPEGATP